MPWLSRIIFLLGPMGCLRFTDPTLTGLCTRCSTRCCASDAQGIFRMQYCTRFVLSPLAWMSSCMAQALAAKTLGMLDFRDHIICLCVLQTDLSSREFRVALTILNREQRFPQSMFMFQSMQISWGTCSGEVTIRPFTCPCAA